MTWIEKGIVGLLWVLALGINGLHGQVTHQGEGWLGYISSVKLTDKWAVWNDAHFVPQSFYIHRHGLTYTLHQQAKLSGGIAWLKTATPFTRQLVRNEHRWWWQIDTRSPLTPKLSFRLRFRHDFRFRQKLAASEVLDERIMYQRLRVMTGFRYTLKQLPNNRSLHFNLLDEVLYNAGTQVRNGLDQNRLYLMLGHSQKGLTVMGGYDWRALPRQNGPFHYRHGFTLWVIHTLDLRGLFVLDQDTP